MKRLSKVYCLILACLVLISLAGLIVFFEPGEVNDYEETGRVVKVIDGDTIKLASGEMVRYIGINAPEIKKAECFAIEAKMKNQDLILGKTIKLEKDVSEKDSHGRLLRYVYIDNLFINLFLVEEGCALSSVWPPDLKYEELFDQAEEKAKEQEKGLWGFCQN